ncbi:MAG TPA: hypothetical protein ENN22_07585 [bacterium]|nr:hypothetical protein [bacterium]
MTSTNTVKQYSFRLILLLIPFLLLILVELLLRMFNYGPDLGLFKPLEQNPQYLQINPGLGARYFPALKIKPQTSYDIMRRVKPTNGFRVFVLGGSTAYGYPYGRNGAFSSFFKDRLEDLIPRREVEVVNLGMCAVGSYAVRDIGMELLNFQPDVILIYAGHNEFYGALGVGSTEFVSESPRWVNFYLKLQHYRTFQFIRDAVFQIKNLFADKQQSAVHQKRLMEHMAGERIIAYNSRLFKSAQQIYEQNLRDLIQAAKRQGVEIYLGELVSNVRDQQPFRSIFNSDSEKERLEKLFIEVENALQNGQYQAGLDRIEGSKAVQNMTAMVYYLRARCLENLNRIEDASQSYTLAKDLDGLRFRAPEVLNDILKKVSIAETTVFLPLKEIFERSSENQIIGSELIIDHLHPNLMGYFLMGKSFFIYLRQYFPWRPDEVFGEQQPDSIYWKKSGVTPLDITEAEFRIQLLINSWPFKNAVMNIDELQWDATDPVNSLAMEILRENMNWEQAAVELAGIYIKHGFYDLALAEFESLIKITPYNVSPYIQSAKIHMNQRRFLDAAKMFLDALEIEESVFAYQGIGEAYLHLGQAQRGIPLLEKGLKLDKENDLTLFLLAKSFLRIGDKKASTDYANKLFQINPKFAGLAKLYSEIESTLQ